MQNKAFFFFQKESITNFFTKRIFKGCFSERKKGTLERLVSEEIGEPVSKFKTLSSMKIMSNIWI